MGFANEVLFNFVGKNPQQPTVISALPIQFVQPLLRGGGRAVVLEPLTQAERNLLYEIRGYARFREDVLRNPDLLRSRAKTPAPVGIGACVGSDRRTGSEPVPTRV